MVKIFDGTRQEIEDRVNHWLKVNPKVTLTAFNQIRLISNPDKFSVAVFWEKRVGKQGYRSIKLFQGSEEEVASDIEIWKRESTTTDTPAIAQNCNWDSSFIMLAIFYNKAS